MVSEAEVDSTGSSSQSSSALFAGLCGAGIALIITAVALFLVYNRNTDKQKDPEFADKLGNGDGSSEGRRISSDDPIYDYDILKSSTWKASSMISSKEPTKEPNQPSTPPSTGSGTPQVIPHLHLSTQPFDLPTELFDNLKINNGVARSRSSIDLQHRPDIIREQEFPYDSTGPPLGGDPHITRPVEPEQYGTSPYMTAHHHSTDYLHEITSPMRPEYSTSPVRASRTSGDNRPQSRQSLEITQSPLEYHDSRDESDIYPQESTQSNVVEPFLEPESRDRSRSRGRSVSPYRHRHASPSTELEDTNVGDTNQSRRSGSRSSESPSPPPEKPRRRRGDGPDIDSPGAPLSSPTITRRARSSRRSGRERRTGGGGGGGGGTTT